MADENGEAPQEFTSKLKTGRERFLAHVIEHALEIELRTAEDFIRHFPPLDLMMGLKDEPTLRAQVLVLTTGIKHKIAVKKPAESAGEDLQIALDEGETDAESIVALFSPDDRVRFLDNEKLWQFCIETQFWKTSSGNRTELDRAKQQSAFMLARALDDRLATHREIVEGIGVGELTTRLPRSELSKVIERALANSHKKAAFTERDLLEALPPEEIVKHIPLPHLWDTVLAPLAEKHGYEKKSSEQVAKALDWLDKEGADGNAEGGDKQASDADEAASTSTEQSTTAEPNGGSGWSMPPDSDDDDVEITDDDIRIT
jgi:hypothetical protein